MAQQTFSLSPSFDVAGLARQFTRQGWIQVRDFLDTKTAHALRDSLVARGDWHRAFKIGDHVANLPKNAYAQLPVDKRRQIELAVYAGVRTGFQFRYENVRVPDASVDRQQADSPLHGFAEFMSTDPTRALLRGITGAGDIGFADAQATAYYPGDFLTSHNDDVAGKNRRAAYVYGLTPDWRPEWGGLLLFHGADGQIDRGLVPAFNVLTIFSVPKLHSVSEVSRAAAQPRYSITGWLRAGRN